MNDLVIADATVLTVDRDDRVLRDSAVAVHEREIAAIGPSDAVLAAHPEAERIDARGMVVLPGLVNGHLHAFTALYKGTMVGFGFERTAGEDTAFCGIATPEEMYAASRLAAVEALRAGITLTNVAGDSPCFAVAGETARAFGEAGLKAFVQTMLGDRLGLLPLGGDAQLAEAERSLRQWHGAFDGRIRVAPSPAAEFTTSYRLMHRLAELAEREGLVTHMHVFPRWPMGFLSWLLRGRSPLGLLRGGHLLNDRLIAVHVLAATRGGWEEGTAHVLLAAAPRPRGPRKESVTMSMAASSIAIERPIAEVFDYAATIANWGVMHPAMARYLVDPPDHPTRVGESFVEHTPMKMDILWTVTECTRPTRWTAQAPIGTPGKVSSLGVFTFSYQLAVTDGGTRFDMSLSFTPRTFLGRLMDLLFFEREDRKDVTMALAHLKHALENGENACH